MEGNPEKTDASENNNISQRVPILRENLVNTAVHFLRNSKVRSSPLSQKRAFLLKKGLTNEEIDNAIERANIPKDLQLVPQDNNISNLNSSVSSSWIKLKDVWSSIVIVGITFYGAYKLYKNFIEPKLFVITPKENKLANIETQLAELNESLSSLKNSLLNVQDSLSQQQQQIKAMKEEINQESILPTIKNEVASIKSILLSRHQFPTSRVTNPSIPSWQMVENDPQNNITAVSISEVDPSTVMSTLTLTSESSTEIIESPENEKVETTE
ncbi:peroxisomal membrane protein PEX14 [Centruroides vittatus]|uniref:peroxisomal membrane protein PEX14 n=1 Tax=Centruroides vittatus TaxID=120091 RepID=UPI00351017B3